MSTQTIAVSTTSVSVLVVRGFKRIVRNLVKKVSNKIAQLAHQRNSDFNQTMAMK